MDQNIVYIKNKNDVRDLLEKYVSKTAVLNRDSMNSVMNKIDSLLSELYLNNQDEPKNMKLEYVKFCNLFSYSGEHQINFNKMDGIVSIHGKNNIGKSAILDIITFAIYGEPIRSNKVDIINIHSSSYITDIHFSINGVNYKVVRKGQLVNNCDPEKRTVNQEFISFYKENKIISSDKSSVNKLIESYTTSRDNFIFSSMILQSNDHSFLEMNDDVKTDLISKTHNLDIFRKLNKNIKSEISRIMKQFDGIKENIKEYCQNESPKSKISKMEKQLEETKHKKYQTIDNIKQLRDKRTCVEKDILYTEVQLDILENSTPSTDMITGVLSYNGTLQNTIYMHFFIYTYML